MGSSLNGTGVTFSNSTTLSTGAGPAFSAYQSASGQSISAGTWTKITFDAEEFDTNNNFASSRFTPTIAGYYKITSVITPGGAGTIGGGTGSRLYKNGAYFKTLYYNNLNSGSFYSNHASSGSALLYLNGSTDYVEIYGYCSGGCTYANDAASTFFQGFFARQG